MRRRPQRRHGIADDYWAVAHPQTARVGRADRGNEHVRLRTPANQRHQGGVSSFEARIEDRSGREGRRVNKNGTRPSSQPDSSIARGRDILDRHVAAEPGCEHRSQRPRKSVRSAATAELLDQAQQLATRLKDPQPAHRRRLTDQRHGRRNWNTAGR